MKKRKLTLLVTSAGRRVALLRCFRQSALDMGLELRIVATDLRHDLSAACRDADASHAVPVCTSSHYVDALQNICRTERVDLLVPTIDPELLPLSVNADALTAIGCRVAVSSPDVVKLCRDKLATAASLTSLGIVSPRTATVEDVLAAPASWSWPVFVKPRDGSASAGIALAASPDELAALAATRSVIVQERLEGREYTVNLFFSRDGKLQSAVPHARIETRAGEVAKGRTERVPSLQRAATELAGGLSGCRGAMCFQAFVDGQGRASVFEINARFGGGYPLAHRAGATATRWLLEETSGAPSTANDAWRDGVLMLRYDDAIFVEDQAN